MTKQKLIEAFQFVLTDKQAAAKVKEIQAKGDFVQAVEGAVFPSNEMLKQYPWTREERKLYVFEHDEI